VIYVLTDEEDQQNRLAQAAYERARAARQALTWAFFAWLKQGVPAGQIKLVGRNEKPYYMGLSQHKVLCRIYENFPHAENV